MGTSAPTGLVSYPAALLPATCRLEPVLLPTGGMGADRCRGGEGGSCTWTGETLRLSAHKCFLNKLPNDLQSEPFQRRAPPQATIFMGGTAPTGWLARCFDLHLISALRTPLPGPWGCT